MARSPSIRVVLTDELDDALRQTSLKENIPAAVIAREAIAKYLKGKYKVTVKEVHPGWGGYRDDSGND